MNEDNILEMVLWFQKSEITEKEIYSSIAKYIKDNKNKNTLLQIADEEQKHYDIWKRYTKQDVQASRIKVLYYVVIAKIFGFTFAIKQLEKRLNSYELSKETSEALSKEIPQVFEIFNDEIKHEEELISLLDEQRLQYVGSMVLGLNDALVEFTGSLAGYTFAMQSNKLISLAGLITGISATLSMTSSEFLSSRAEGNDDAFKSASYTGIAYLLTVIMLILPYILLPEKMYSLSLAIMLIVVIAIIAVFNYYISVAKDMSFKKRFLEMASISLSVALLSFVIGIIIKQVLGVDL